MPAGSTAAWGGSSELFQTDTSLGRTYSVPITSKLLVTFYLLDSLMLLPQWTIIIQLALVRAHLYTVLHVLMITNQ